MDFMLLQEFFYLFYLPVLVVAVIGYLVAGFLLAVFMIVRVIIFRPERG